MKKIHVLGAGRIGAAIARDFSEEFHTVLHDINKDRLGYLTQNFELNTAETDVTNLNNLASAVSDADLVISAVPGFMGFDLLSNLIELGKNVVDISFFNRNPFDLQEKAISKGLTVVVDCGVAPGLCNIILGHHLRENPVSYKCMVGGLPYKRIKPFEYKAPFSPIDVIEEYTRPARIRVNGNIEIVPALTEKEIVHFDQCGELEAFNTDGLRSLLQTTSVPNMKEKTLRYLGHASIMEAFRDGGFFSPEIRRVNGLDMRPLDFTSNLLFNHWLAEEGEDEFTIMRIEIETDDTVHSYEVFDRYDKISKTSSMARTTGYTCTAVGRLLLNGMLNQKGIVTPEEIGNNQSSFDFVLNDLKNKNILPEYISIPK